MTDEKALRVPDYLGHIIDAAQRIAIYTAGMARERFLASSLVQDAVIRRLLDANDLSITLATMSKAAAALGRSLRLKLAE